MLDALVSEKKNKKEKKKKERGGKGKVAYFQLVFRSGIAILDLMLD